MNDARRFARNLSLEKSHAESCFHPTYLHTDILFGKLSPESPVHATPHKYHIENRG